MVLHLKNTQLEEMYNAAVSRSDVPIIFEALPTGTYLLEARVAARSLASWEEGQEVHVGVPPSRFSLDVSRLGYLKVHILKPDGSEYTGPAHLRLLTQNGRSVYRDDAFDAAPYRIAVLDPGSYQVQIGSNPRFPSGDKLIGQAVIEAGLVAELTLR